MEYVMGTKIKDQDVAEADRLRTRRTGARYGTKVTVGGRPAVLISSRGNQDYLTPEELLEDLYGRKVEGIVFAGGTDQDGGRGGVDVSG